MMISEEALYAAAPEAAEKFLSALPDREDCVHDFSPDFEARCKVWVTASGVAERNPAISRAE